MDEIVMQASNREVIGKKVKVLRKEGILPAIIYGQGIDPTPISLDMRASVRILSTTTASNLVEIQVDGKSITTLVRDRQYDPVTGAMLHVDFMRVSMTETLTTSVGLELVGESPAAKTLGGILVTSQEQIEVEALPQDLPDHIAVDISVLEEIGDSIFVRDLPIPENVEVLTSMDEMVILVMPPAAEEEEEEEEDLLEEGEEPEVIERGREEDGEEEAEEE